MKNGENTVVLVIDDDRVVRESIASYLTDNGFRVVLAESSVEGINAFHSSNPGLVIYDINMPGKSGFDTLSTIFNNSPTKPIIVLSEIGDTQDVIKAMKLGVSDYLIKPLVDLEILGISIENSLNRARLVVENNRYRKSLEEINRELEEKIEIFQMDQQAGRHVQISMLPTPPQNINNFHFDHRVIPSLFLSGDSVDYKPISKNKVLFYIGDVSGHGSSSAFITVLLRFRIEQVRREHIRGRFSTELSPAFILDLLNRDLLDTGLDKHITVCMCILDDEENTLEYSIAGHHPLPIIYENGEARFIEPDKSSFPIGLVGEAIYFNVKIRVSKDFALYLFSDGILEHITGEDMEEKEGKILAAISEHKGNFTQVKTSLNLHPDIKVPDDIAVLSASRL